MVGKNSTSNPTSIMKSFDKNGNLVEQNLGQYLIPIVSMAVFFIAVFISSSPYFRVYQQKRKIE